MAKNRTVMTIAIKNSRLAGDKIRFSVIASDQRERSNLDLNVKADAPWEPRLLRRYRSPQ
jgi:hypothetical protein